MTRTKGALNEYMWTEKILNNEEITFYLEDETLTVKPSECIYIRVYEHWWDMCEDWLNTGIPIGDDCYRHENDTDRMERDKSDYYDYKKDLWFIVEC